MSGAKHAGISTLDTRPCQFTACCPAAAIVAPMTPPISDCDELDGIPKNQVSTFQARPPAKPAATTVSVTNRVFTRPLAIVAATLRERNAPTRLSVPEIATATRGDNAPVAIEVAIALPVSWKPLVKSNASAITTTRASNTHVLPCAAGRPIGPVRAELRANAALLLREVTV